jgi:dTDP-4-amino-4,6-dideoxygalactose transaminase
MIATNDPRLANAARALRNHGQDATNPQVDFVRPGLNYRMTEFQAVLGDAALRRFRDRIAVRRELAAAYDALLADCVEVPYVAPGSEPVFQSYVVLLPAAISPRRAELIATLRDKEVEATIGTWSIPTTTFYRSRYGYDETSYPVTSDVFARSLALPMHEKLTAEDQATVSAALHEAVAELL